MLNLQLVKLPSDVFVQRRTQQVKVTGRRFLRIFTLKFYVPFCFLNSELLVLCNRTSW